MPLGGNARSLLALILLALAASGCLARRRVITRNGRHTTLALRTAAKPVLLAKIAEDYRAIETLQATVDMTPALGSAEKGKVTEYKDVRGYILFRKPALIRLIGLYPVVRNKAFDMVSDGERFRLYLPVKNRFIEGANEITRLSKNKIENLRPQHFLDALLVRPADSEQSLLVNFTDEDNAAYIVQLVDGSAAGGLRLKRQVWFERVNLTVVRQLIFDEAGDILTDARYGGWQTHERVPFPTQIEINRPKDEYGVVMKVVRVEVNKPLEDARFELPRPEGAELQILERH